jgi:hypothetical protein
MVADGDFLHDGQRQTCPIDTAVIAAPEPLKGILESAALVIINIPFALIGGILALAIVGLPLSVSAAIGFIALFSQAALNGVVLVAYFDQLRAQGLSTREAVRLGAATRLRTVLMTAMLAMFGLLPMALSHAIGSETQRPLAIVIIGGLVWAITARPASRAICTTIISPRIPCAFDWVRRLRDPRKIGFQISISRALRTRHSITRTAY